MNRKRMSRKKKSSKAEAPQLQQMNMNNNNGYTQYQQQQMPSSLGYNNGYSNNNSYMQYQQQMPSSYGYGSNIKKNNYKSAENTKRRNKKKATGKRLKSKQCSKLPTSRIDQQVELDSNITAEQFLTSVQSAYGSNARVEINKSTSNYNGNASRQQISYQVVFDNQNEAQTAYAQNAVLQQQVAANLGIKGSAMAFDKPCEPKSIDGITLQLDSDSSSILCGACLIYDNEDKCVKIVHYSDRNYMNVIKHSGDTQVHGKSVHTLKLSLSDLSKDIKQLFFTLCACGPSDLSQFKEPVISLYENDDEDDVNLIQYAIEQAGKSRSVVMCRLFRADADNQWSIQALGSEEWHIQNKVCMAYHHARGLIDAHLKVMREEEAKKEKKEKEEEGQTKNGQNDADENENDSNENQKDEQTDK